MNFPIYVRVTVDFDDRVMFLLNQLLRGVLKMNASVDSLALEITNLQADVAAEQTVETSAVTLINGFAAQLAAAVAAAQAAGATPEQLAALSALHTQINSSSAGLAAAVAANTTPAPAPAAA